MRESTRPSPADSAPILQRRLLRPADLALASEFLPRWLGLDGATRARLPALWRRLLPHAGFNADVIEDVTAPPRTRPMSEAEIGRANASGSEEGGVTFLVLHYQQRYLDLADARAVAVVSAGLTAMRMAHAGHRVREIFQEAWGDEQAVMEGIGLIRRSRREDGEATRLPELFGISRREALRRLPGYQIREVFEHRAPLLGFRGAEQRLLRRALFDEPEDEIAAILALSPHTLKKLWRSIYARVDERFPSLLGDGAVGATEGVRGREKRRTLMSYLRQHPEELRPWPQRLKMVA